VLTAAIVGRAWRTPLGNTIDSAMARLYAGERAAMTDPRGAYACTTIAPIRDEPARTRNSRFLRRMGLFGLEVAIEALAASGVAGGARTGLFSGVGGLRAHWDDMIAGFANQRDDGERMWERGLCNVHPYWMLRHLSNNVHALASAELDLRGEGATFGGANGGAQAIAAAIRALHDGAIDAAVVVAYDSLLEPETLVELAARGGATRASLDALVAPYAPGANGFVPGEAAAALVLVRERAGAPTIAVRDAAGPDALARCIALATSDATGDATGAPAGDATRGSTSDLGHLGGASASDLGHLEGASASTSDLGHVHGASTSDLGHLDGASPWTSDLGHLDGASTSDLGHLDGASTSDLGHLDGASPSTSDLGIIDGAALASPDHDRAERAALPASAILTATTAAMGQLGAATAIVQAIALVEMLRARTAAPIAGHPDGRTTAVRARAALGLSAGAPALAAATRVEVPA
jgi:3-oxoacyl-(acyl-carrier-protein) synthase